MIVLYGFCLQVGKLDVGLGLKQKYVSSLVQKWQQIQNEIK